MAKKFDYIIKLVVAGEPGVGKTSLISRYIDDSFPQGVDFRIKIVNLDGKLIKLMIWDTPQEKFHSIIKSHYFQGTHGVIITFDITNQNSFKSNRLWVKEFENKLPYQPCIILVGTKCDLDQREVTEEEGNVLARYFNAKYFEISSKTNQNITEAFNYLIREVIKAQQDGKFSVKEKPKMEVQKKIENKESCILI